MSYYFNPLDKSCKSVTGAVSRGSEVTFHVYKQTSGECDFSADVCTFVFFEDNGEKIELPMRKDEYGFKISLVFHNTGLFFYYFQLKNTYLGCGKLRRGELCEHPNPWQITVFDEEYSTPEWLKGGVMYQIFPDRFYKSGEYPVPAHKILRRDWGGIPSYKPNEQGKVLNNDFFGGNLNGVREKLSYLATLSVSVIYFNPIFEAFSNHRYDTGDYMKIDSLLGTVEDFDALIDDAKGRGIRFILDGVFNHTGDDSRYFNKYGRYKEELGAHQSPDSPYADWYHFTDFPDEYDSWWGIDVLPAVNEHSMSYQEFILGQSGVVRTWLRHGIGGYRIDVADELPDFFLEKLRTSVKTENPEAVIIGEVWEDASNKIAYDERRKYLQGYELDSVMNYPLKDAILNFMLTGSTAMLRETVLSLIDNYPKQTLDCLMNVLGTHDTPRILTVLSGKTCTDKDEMAASKLTETERELAKKKQKMAAVLQYTMPGVPCVYYGDEIGMEGYQDPFCRRCYDWNSPESELLDFYRLLGEIRTQKLKKFFTDGEYNEIFADVSCLVFERRTPEGAVYVFVNNGASEYTLHFEGRFVEHLSGQSGCDKLKIRGFSYGILSKQI